MNLGCKIVNVYRDEMDEAFEIIERDIYEILEEAEQLFNTNGIHLGRGEEIYEVCLDTQEKVVGASSLQPLGEDPIDGLPLFRFSLVTLEQARRRGIARRLTKSIIEAHGRDESVLEAWVVNPAMVALLESFGMEPIEGEWTPDSPFMRRVNPGGKDLRGLMSARDLLRAKSLWDEYQKMAEYIDFMYQSGAHQGAERAEDKAEALLEELENFISEIQDEGGDETTLEYEGRGYELYPSAVEEFALMYNRYHNSPVGHWSFDNKAHFVKSLRAMVYENNRRSGDPVEHLADIPDQAYIDAARDAFERKMAIKQRMTSSDKPVWGKFDPRPWGGRRFMRRKNSKDDELEKLQRASIADPQDPNLQARLSAHMARVDIPGAQSIKAAQVQENNRALGETNYNLGRAISEVIAGLPLEYRVSQSSWVGGDHSITVNILYHPFSLAHPKFRKVTQSQALSESDASGGSQVVWHKRHTWKGTNSFWRFWLPPNWLAIHKRGMSTIDGKLVLALAFNRDKSIQPKNFRGHAIKRSWNAVIAVQGRGFGLRRQRGLLLEASDGTMWWESQRSS